MELKRNPSALKLAQDDCKPATAIVNGVVVSSLGLTKQESTKNMKYY